MADVFEKTTETAGKIAKGTRNTFRQALNYILLLVLIIVTAVFSFTTVEIANVFSLQFFINLAYLIVINIFSMISFIPQGEKNEKEKSATYSANLTLWGTISASLIQAKQLMAFHRYCKYLTERLKQEKKENYIISASIDMDFYNKHLKNLSKKELQQYLKPTMIYAENDTEHKNGELFQLSRQQIKLIMLSRGIIKVNAINPLKVLNGSNKTDQYDVARNKMPYKEKTLIHRIFQLVLWSILCASVILVPTGSIGWASICMFIFRIFSIALYAFIGFSTGVNQIKHDNEDIKDRVIFINEFLEHPAEQFEKQETKEIKNGL